jgi:hypothetical protein
VAVWASAWVKIHISHFKDNAAKMVEITRPGAPLIIPRNGEAPFLVQDIKSREQQQQTMALLMILALGKQQIERGEVHLAKDVLPNSMLRFRRKPYKRKIRIQHVLT